MSRTNRAALAFWQRESKKMPYLAHTPDTVEPSSLRLDRYGHPISIVLEPRVRTWAFRHITHRDQFVSEVSGAVLHIDQVWA